MAEKNFQNIAQLIRKYRHKTDLSQTDLSVKLNYKNGQFISNVERGLCSVPLKTLKQIAEVLSIPSSELRDAMLQDYALDIDNALGNDVKLDNGVAE